MSQQHQVPVPCRIHIERVVGQLFTKLHYCRYVSLQKNATRQAVSDMNEYRKMFHASSSFMKCQRLLYDVHLYHSCYDNRILNTTERYCKRHHLQIKLIKFLLNDDFIYHIRRQILTQNCPQTTHPRIKISVCDRGGFIIINPPPSPIHRVHLVKFTSCHTSSTSSRGSQLVTRTQRPAHSCNWLQARTRDMHKLYRQHTKVVALNANTRRQHRTTAVTCSKAVYTSLFASSRRVLVRKYAPHAQHRQSFCTRLHV
jgi:hypothetical protein